MSTNVVGLGQPRTDAVPALAVWTTDQTPGAVGAKEHVTRGRAGLDSIPIAPWFLLYIG